MGRFDIPESELKWRFDTSGGPGGQHANRSSTRVEVTFDVDTSTAFSGQERERLIARLGPMVRIVEAGSRSQSTNRKRAIRRLHAMLEEAARSNSPTRRSTKPSRAARRRRIEDKRARGALKNSRRRPPVE
ncbi:MAG: alternative ribosome rescue aminoacyl-tRNA hydrolase ArfB [Actinomycetota bacterium]